MALCRGPAGHCWLWKVKEKTSPTPTNGKHMPFSHSVQLTCSERRTNFAGCPPFSAAVPSYGSSFNVEWFNIVHAKRRQSVPTASMTLRWLPSNLEFWSAKYTPAVMFECAGFLFVLPTFFTFYTSAIYACVVQDNQTLLSLCVFMQRSTGK